MPDAWVERQRDASAEWALSVLLGEIAGEQVGDRCQVVGQPMSESLIYCYAFIDAVISRRFWNPNLIDWFEYAQRETASGLETITPRVLVCPHCGGKLEV